MSVDAPETPAPRPPEGRMEIQLRKSADSGGTLPASPDALRQVLIILLLVPGLFLSLFVQGVYPPLDTRLPMGILLGLFLLPFAVQVVGFVRKWSSEGMRRCGTIYRLASLALVLLAVLLFLNGRLDKAPGNEVRARVFQKSIVRGRRTTSYHLRVASWRPGRNVEDLDVSEKVFERVVVGRTVAFQAHQGYFGLPWRGKVAPE
jgi:hypothetical protein